MKTFQQLENQLKELEAKSDNEMLYITLDDGRNIKINCGSQDGLINLMRGMMTNKQHPYRKYFKHAVKGHPEQGSIVLACKSIINSIDLLEAD